MSAPDRPERELGPPGGKARSVTGAAMSVLGLSRPVAAPGTLRVLAALLSYPDARVRGHLPEMLEILRRENALPVGRRAELEALIARLRGDDPLDVEAEYVQLFDRGRSTSLHLFEHVHGDSRDRGPAMIDLAQTYAKAGLLLSPAELPDYLPAVLEFVSTQPPREAKAFLGEMVAHSQCHLRRPPETRKRVRERAGRPAGARGREGAAGRGADRGAARRDLGRAAGVRRLLVEGAGTARRAAADSVMHQEGATDSDGERRRGAAANVRVQR